MMSGIRTTRTFRFLLLFIRVLVVIPAAAAVAAPSCDVERDDIRFFGSGGDAGRVELCHPDDATWRYVCAHPDSVWNLATANVACRQLGYRSAFMAQSAAAMAFGATVDSGIAPDAPGIFVAKCQGDETSLRDCQLQFDSTDPACTVHRAVGAACSTASSDTAASTYPVAIEEQVQNFMQEMEAWYASEQDRLQQNSAGGAEECVNADAVQQQPAVQLQGIPTPFRDESAIKQAFIFPDDVILTYQQIESAFNRSAVHAHADWTTMTSTTEKLFQDSLSKIRWNAFGMDFSDFFPPPMTLEQAKAVLQQTPFLQNVRDLYLSANQHNALHWFLDAPYRYYSQPAAATPEGQLLLNDPAARRMFDALQRDGIVVIEDFGADMDAIVQQAQAALTGEALYRKSETSIAGGGSIITSRKPIPQLEDLLIHNQSLAAVVSAYLGPSLLHGYKVTHLTKGLNSTDQYNAGMYHHDRVGRRLKLFLFINDVDCEKGHPTKVAAGSHKLLYYKTEDYPVTRFSDRYVEQQQNYPTIVKGCGRRGGGFLFDTHTIHKGTVHGSNERTVVIAEYHHVAKCAYSKQHRLGIPCPGGDIHRTDAPLTIRTVVDY